jgi:hypothetical protein
MSLYNRSKSGSRYLMPSRNEPAGFEVEEPTDADFSFFIFIGRAGNVPSVVENGIGGLAAEQTGTAVEITNETHQTHEATKAQSAGRSQPQIV